MGHPHWGAPARRNQWHPANSENGWLDGAVVALLHVIITKVVRSERTSCTVITSRVIGGPGCGGRSGIADYRLGIADYRLGIGDYRLGIADWGMGRGIGRMKAEG